MDSGIVVHLPEHSGRPASRDTAPASRIFFADAEIEARFEPATGILWAEMRHATRACFTPALLDSGEALHARIADAVRHGTLPARYLAWTSGGSAFSLGGDLAFFLDCVRNGERAKLHAYAERCIDLVWITWRALDLPLRTVAVVEGDALGGGFEAALACDLIVAEQGAKFGFPEALFGLFPGMGAWSLLSRRINRREVGVLIEESRTRSAEELHELGLVHTLAESGRARDRLRRLAAERERFFGGDLALDRVRRRVEGLTREELSDIVATWVERAFELEPAMLRRMEHFARCQTRKSGAVRDDATG